MYDSVITGNENAYKDWNCIILMFLTSFIHCPFCVWLSMHILCVYICLKTTTWLFLVKTGWQSWDVVRLDRHCLAFMCMLIMV